MAARRLLIVMLILLGISTVAAALAPTRSRQNATTSATTAPAVPLPTALPGAGRATLLRERVEAKPYTVTLIPGCSRRKQKRCLRAGDELVLTVASKGADQVEIGGLGEVQPVSRFAPAHFDLLLDQPGSYNVRLVDANRVVGRLEVSPAAQRGRGRARASAGRGRR